MHWGVNRENGSSSFTGDVYLHASVAFNYKKNQGFVFWLFFFSFKKRKKKSQYLWCFIVRSCWLLIWFKYLNGTSHLPPNPPPLHLALPPSLRLSLPPCSFNSASEEKKKTVWKLLSYLIMDLVASLQA